MPTDGLARVAARRVLCQEGEKQQGGTVTSMASKLGKRDLEKEAQRVDADTLEAKLKRVSQITEELRKLSGEINEALSKGSEAVLKERAKLAEELKVMAERYKIDDDVLDLNVGGSDIVSRASRHLPRSLADAHADDVQVDALQVPRLDARSHVLRTPPAGKEARSLLH